MKALAALGFDREAAQSACKVPLGSREGSTARGWAGGGRGWRYRRVLHSELMHRLRSRLLAAAAQTFGWRNCVPSSCTDSVWHSTGSRAQFVTFLR